MYRFKNYLQAGVLAIGVLAHTSPATAQTWSSPVTIANGNGLAVATNGSGYFCRHFYSAFRRSSGFCENRQWLVGTRYSHVSHSSGQHCCRAQWRCLSGVEFPHYHYVHTNRSPGCILPRWTLGKYADPFDQRIWKRFQCWFAQHRVLRIQPGNRGVGTDYQSQSHVVCIASFDGTGSQRVRLAADHMTWDWDW